MSITAAMVKQLRDRTGVGMMDCKTALAETNGDLEAAVDWLRKKGLSKAAKKAGRVAAEGLIGVSSTGQSAAVVEVNSETDFVARNDHFQDLVRNIAGVSLSTGGDLEKTGQSTYPGSGHSVSDEIVSAVATVGENMTLRRAAGLSVTEGVVASYVHGSVAPNLGKIGVLVALQSSGDQDKLEQLGRQIAMHIAATNPHATTEADLDATTVERERAVYADQARQSGKPENIIEKMVDGRMRKFFEEVVLLKQAFVIDTDKTVEKAVKDAEADVGAPIVVAGFVRMALGEGIEKEETDFAAEVAAAAQGS